MAERASMYLQAQRTQEAVVSSAGWWDVPFAGRKTYVTPYICNTIERACGDAWCDSWGTGTSRWARCYFTVVPYGPGVFALI